jgi:hypothetical protein
MAQHAAIEAFLFHPRDLEVQVGAVHPANHHVGVAQPQPLDDVRAHPGSGGGRQRQHRRPLAQTVERVAQAEVRGPEAVAPLRDAVRLVDHEQRDPQLAGLRHELLVLEPLGCDVQQLRATVAVRGACQRLVQLALGLRAAQPADLQPALGERLDLVLHERQEG